MASQVAIPIQSSAMRQPRTQLHLLPRISGLAGLFAAELLLISARTPHFALHDASGLPGLVFSLGVWKIRLLVTLGAVSLLFWQARGRENLERFSMDLGSGRIAWRWLVAHFAAMLLFGGLTALLFEDRLQGLAADSLVVAWTLAGASGVVLGALGFLPSPVWRALLRGTRDVWAYVAMLAVGGCVFATQAISLWQPLTRWTLVLASAMLRPILSGVAVNPVARTFGTPSFTVEVAPACSGYEGIGLILAFTTAWLWFFRKEWRFPRALLLIPAGVLSIWTFNAARVAVLVLIGAAGAPDIAMQGFHSHAGWITFNVAALGTCLAARRISWLTASSAGNVPAERSRQNPAAAYLMPFLAILAAAMIAGAASSEFEWVYALRVLAGAAALWYFRDSYRRLNWRVGWPAVMLGGLVFLIWIALEPLAGSAHAAEPAALASAPSLARLAWLAVRIVGAVITVPIAEELAFRGFLLRRLASADFESVALRAFAWAPFLISSVAFGLLHGERWLAGTIAGMVYAFAIQRRGRIGEAVVAHAVTNALLAAYVLTTGNWQLW